MSFVNGAVGSVRRAAARPGDASALNGESIMFESVNGVISDLNKEGYICDKQIATVVFLAQQLGKPVLVEGPAGVGKTWASSPKGCGSRAVASMPAN